MHALIIEPQVLVGMMLEEELRDLGFTSCDSAYTQESAIECAEQTAPDLIVASLRLASGNGIDAVRAICADRAIPTVFTVSNPEEAEPLVGNSSVITKPISKMKLRAAVQRAMKMQ